MLDKRRKGTVPQSSQRKKRFKSLFSKVSVRSVATYARGHVKKWEVAIDFYPYYIKIKLVPYSFAR